MAKVTLKTISNLQDDQSAVAAINENMATIANFLETLLSRDGVSPNQILADIDMNSKRIYNLASPTSLTEPVTKKDLEDLALASSSGSILPGSITEPDFATGAVSTRALADNSVTTIKILNSAITSAKIGTGEVKTSNILDNNVTFAKLPTISNNTVLGNISGSTGAVAEVTLSALALALLSGSTALVPTGSILPYAITKAPSGYLICDGSAVSRTTYSSLFNVLNPSLNVTFNTGTNAVVWAAHPFVVNDRVVFTTTGSLPSGITAGTTYYVKTVNDVNSFTLSSSPGGSVLTLSGSPTGTHSAQGVGYGLGDGSTTFNLPDYRGEFLRGFDHSRGVDANRYIGSFQDHQFQDHKHSLLDYWVYSSGVGYFGGGGFTNAAPSNPVDGNHGSETRPRNININFIIKT